MRTVLEETPWIISIVCNVVNSISLSRRKLSILSKIQVIEKELLLLRLLHIEFSSSFFVLSSSEISLNRCLSLACSTSFSMSSNHRNLLTLRHSHTESSRWSADRRRWRCFE
jgi:hypothetical protein